jgi:transcription initiation factor TFIID subunit 2
LWDRCTWDLEFTVPRILYSTSSDAPPPTDDDDGGDDENTGEWPISVLASGELIEQVVHPTRSDRVIWHYGIATPVSVQQIAWAVGPFVTSEIIGSPKVKGEEETIGGVVEEIEEEVVDDGPKLYALCLPGREAELSNSVGAIRQAMDFYTAKFGSYPFSSYSVVFVDSLASGSPTFHSAAMTIFSSDTLHPPSIIEPAYESRHLFAHALAVQWSGMNLIPRAPSDTWLITGIALHITSLFLRSLWGNNEYRFRLKKDIMRCVEQDVQREPICVPIFTSPHEPDQLQFIALKAPLVLHILDKQLRKFGTSLGLDKVLPKLFLDAITGDLGSHSSMTLNALSSSHFLRICRKACGGSADLYKTFADQWIYGSGCPHITIEANFNRKRMAVELNVQQESRAAVWTNAAPPEEIARTRPAIELFEGQLTVRIHEADGTPYEHIINIGERFKRHEVPFNTKYKRIRRNTKRYQAREAAAAAAALGDAEAQEDMNMIDAGFGLAGWDDKQEREKWKVADWSEEDDVLMSQATYEWIRVDADMEWIAIITLRQPDFMWLSQLQRDRDVVAQLEVSPFPLSCYISVH